MTMNCREYKLGEKKYVDYEIRPKNTADTLVISSATWKLKKDGIIESEGDCEINELTVSALIAPTSRCQYILTVTVEVAPETIIEECLISVI